MIRTILTIQKTAFIEIVRHPAYYLLTLATAFVIFISQFINLFSFRSEINIIRELGISTMVLWGVIACILFTYRSVYSELENRSAMSLLSKPVPRSAYILGKYLGLLRSLLIGLLLLTLVLILTLWVHEGIPKLERTVTKASTAVVHLFCHQTPGDSIEGPVKSLGGTAVGAALTSSTSPGEIVWTYFFDDFMARNVWPMLVGAFLAFLHTAVVASFALGLATFAPPVVVATGTLTFYLIGHLTDKLHDVTSQMGTFLAIVGQLMRSLLPNLEHFNPAEHLSQGEPLSAIYIALAVAYGILYASVILGMTTFAFSRRELP
jgi:ABC-type transport system involved in multi-copper enzyme maturation permease subunit